VLNLRRHLTSFQYFVAFTFIVSPLTDNPRETMMRRLTRYVLTLGVMALALAAGCTKASPESTGTPTATESRPAEEDAEAEAIQGASQAIRDYYQVRDQCMADPPTTDPSCFDDVAMDSQLDQHRLSLQGAQENGVHFSGAVKVVGTDRVLEVRLQVGEVREVVLSACIDGTEFDVLQQDGTSLIPPNDPPRIRSTYTVRKWTDTWKIASIQHDQEEPTC